MEFLCGSFEQSANKMWKTGKLSFPLCLTFGTERGIVNFIVQYLWEPCFLREGRTMTDTAQQQKKTLLMTEGSIWKSILLFSVPLILGNLLQQLYNTADSIIVGNFLGSNALAAVGSSGSPIYLLIGFSQGVAVGAGVVVSQYLGAKDKKETRIAVHTSLAIAAILGLILTVGGIAVSRTLLVWMNTPDEVLGDAVTYMKLYFGGVLFSVIYNMAAGILNAAGNSRRSVLYLACASITNIILDLVFIAGLKMGVAGAAIATDISQLVSCVLSLRFLMKVDADYKVELSSVRPDKRMTSRIIRIGLPTGIQNMVISFSNVLVQSSVNSYGAAAMAGFAAYMKIDGFNILPVTSFSMAATTFVGQNYGAGNLKRVKKGTWVTLAMGVLYTLCTGTLLLAFQNPIMHLFTSDETVVSFGCIAMHYFCPFYFLLSILHGMAGAVRGTGHSVPPMVVLLVSLCLFRVVWIQFVLPFFSGIEGVFVLYPVSWALGAVLMVLYAWKGSWMTYDHS
jgi:MATE efflux family protein